MARIKEGRRVWSNESGWKFYLAIQPGPPGKRYLELWSEELGYLKARVPGGKSVEALSDAEISGAYREGLKRAGYLITAKELKSQLQTCYDDDMIYMGGLDFYRMKRRGNKVVQMEFSQQVWHDPQTGEVTVENVGDPLEPLT